jgi:glucose-1-phosphate adenylyltransferase
MVNINALGIIFPNTYDELVPQLVKHRTMASVPFGGRYRMIDFTLSGMVNAGIENVTVIAKKNYHSLMDHLGSGREWDLVRKRGGLNIVPPYAQSQSKVYHGRVEALYSIVNFLAEQKEKYVVISDCNVASDLNFAHLIDAHVKRGANVPMVYERAEIESHHHGQLYVYDGRCRPCDGDPLNALPHGCAEPFHGRHRDGPRGAHCHGKGCGRAEPQVPGAGYSGPQFEDPACARVMNKAATVHASMTSRATLTRICAAVPENVSADVPTSACITPRCATRPCALRLDCQVHRCIVADGCIIEGEVENCVLFRGVKVSKVRMVKNCVLMQGTLWNRASRWITSSPTRM